MNSWVWKYWHRMTLVSFQGFFCLSVQMAVGMSLDLLDINLLNILDILGKVEVYIFSRFLRQIFEVCADGVYGMFWLEELNETGFDIIPAFLVDLEEVQQS